jgi:importin subunit alpha-1
MFGTTKQQLEVTKRFRSLLSTDSSSVINKVIGAGLVPKFVEFLQHDDVDLQNQAICALTTITAGNSLQTKCVVEAGAVPVLVKMLSSTSENLQENAVFCLDNIAVDGPEFRDLTLDHGILSPLLKYVNKFFLSIFMTINFFIH